MAWVVEHIAPDATVTDVTGLVDLVRSSVPFRGNADGVAATLVLPNPGEFVPDDNAAFRIREEGGEEARVWFYGRVAEIERTDVGEVAGLAPGYSIGLVDIGGLLRRRIIPGGADLAERRARCLPPTVNEDSYDGTFSNPSIDLYTTATRKDHEYVLEWALQLINDREEVNEANFKGRLIPALDTANTVYGKPDLVRFPPLGGISISATSGEDAYLIADGDPDTYWQSDDEESPELAIAWDSDQAITKFSVRTGPNSYNNLTVELRNSDDEVLYAHEFGSVSSNTLKAHLASGDVYPVRSMVIREAGSGSVVRSLAAVTAVDTFAFYAKRQDGVLTGYPIDAQHATYSTLLSSIATAASIGWFVDPGTVGGGPRFVGYNAVRPSFADFEIVDGAPDDLLPIREGATLIPARSLAVSAVAGDLANRILVPWIEDGAKTRWFWVPDNEDVDSTTKAAAAESQLRYGVREKVLDRNDIKSKELALKVATKELLRNLSDEVSGSARIPFTPDLRPGVRVYLHRTQHQPAVAPADYNIAVATIRSISLAWEHGNSEPLWMDLDFGDASEAAANVGAGDSSSVVGGTAVSGGVKLQRVSATGRPAWGSQPTYVIGGPGQNMWGLAVPPIWHMRGLPDYMAGALFVPADPTPLDNQNYDWNAGWPGWGLSFPYEYPDRYPGDEGSEIYQAAYPISTYHQPGYGSAPALFNFNGLAPEGVGISRAMFVWCPYQAPRAPIDIWNPEDPPLYEYQTTVWAATASKLWVPGAPNYPSPTPRRLATDWPKTTGGRDNYNTPNGGMYFTPGGLLQHTWPRFSHEFQWEGSGGMTVAVGAIANSPEELGKKVTPDAYPLFTAYGEWQNYRKHSIAMGDFADAGQPAWTYPEPIQWFPEAPMLSWGFDPTNPGDNPVVTSGFRLNTEPYLVFMLGETPPAQGTFVEERPSFADRTQVLTLRYPALPDGIIVRINGEDCSEQNGRLALIFGGSGLVTQIDLSRGANPIRPNGLRTYELPGAPPVVDNVLIRYEVG